MRKNNTFVAKQVTTRLTKALMAIFALAERLPTSATLLHTTHFTTNPDRQSIASDPWYKNMQYKGNYKKILQSEFPKQVILYHQGKQSLLLKILN